jgi:Protein phosphatase 2C
MSADTSQQPPQETQHTWVALTASQRGAAHQAVGLPNQDAVRAQPAGPHAVVAAVADGHGHRRHFRSARGAALAVTVACEAAAELAARLDEFEAAEQLQSEALGTLVPAIAGRWRAAVAGDLAVQPFTDEDQAARFWGDDPLIAYGSTLLLAVAGSRWLVLVQIGDGDIVGVQPGGHALLPVPPDPSLDGLQTTSLCGPRAEEDFRAGVVDLSRTALLGVLMATDGYGNAQATDPWADAVSADLAVLIAGQPPERLAAQLPAWASRCASADGSADDTTVALLIAPSTPGDRSKVPTVPVPIDVGRPARPPVWLGGAWWRRAWPRTLGHGR